MNNIKKYVCTIAVLFLMILFWNIRSSYANKLSDMIDYVDKYKKVDTIARQNMNMDDTINNSGENYYCITKDKGSTSNETTKYSICSFYKIDSTGIHFFSRNNGSYYDWGEIEWGDMYSEQKIIGKKMFYILNEGDNSYFGGDILVKGSTDSKGESHPNIRISQKQYAIWMYIRSFFEEFDETPVLLNGSSNVYGDPFKSNTDLKILNGKEPTLYNNAESNVNENYKINGNVYIWVYSPDGLPEFEYTWGEKNYWQQLILAGKSSTSTSPVTPTPTPVIGEQKCNFKIIKKDEESGQPIKVDTEKNTIRFGLRKAGKSYGSNIFEYLAKVNGSGECIFNNIDPGEYYIYEIENDLSGYSLEEQANHYSDMIWENGYVKITTKYRVENDSSVTIMNYKKKGSLKIKKTDDSGNIIESGVQFGLRKEGKSYDKNKFYRLADVDNGICQFNNLDPGNYYLYEIKNTNSGYSLKEQADHYYDMIMENDYVKINKIYTVSDGGNTEVTIKNYKTPSGSITIKKVDSKNNDIFLQGAEFVISTDKKTKTSNSKGQTEWTTDSFGTVTISDLKVDKTYYIYESKAPKGYQLKNPVDGLGVLVGIVKVGPSGGTASITVENPKLGSITLTKKDQDGTLINGIYFDLLKVDGINKNTKEEYEKYLSGLEDTYYKKLKVANSQYTGESAGKGKVKFDNLEFGKYILRETNLKEGVNEGFKRNIGSIVNSDGVYILEVNENNVNISITRENINYGGLTLQKKGPDNSFLQGVGFKLYKIANEDLQYVCTLADTDNQGKTSSSSGLESRNSSIKLKNAHGVNTNTLYTLEPGTYYLYEYKNPNKGYNIKYQGQYYDKDRGAYIGEITIEAGKITNVNSLKYTYEDPNDSNKEKSVSYGDNEPFVSIEIKKFMEGYDSDVSDVTRQKLKGAGFTLFKGGKKFKIRNITDSDYTEEFFSDKDGYVKIERIPVGATYTLYETTFPVWKDSNGKEYGIDPEIQPGYDSSLGYVKIATITVNKDGTINVGSNTNYGDQTTDNDNGDGVTLVTDKKTLKEKNDDRTISYKTYRRKCVSDQDKGKETKVTLWITNRRFIKISGYAWEDIGADTKNPGIGNNIYEKNTKDVLMENITVKLYDKSKNELRETTETKNGEYKFEKWVLSKDLKNGLYYVEFDYSGYSKIANNSTTDSNGYWHVDSNGEYDRYLYMPVEPNIGNIQGSKVLTETVLPTEDKKMITDNLYKAKTGYRRK